MDKNYQRVFKMSFASVYPHYVQKAEKKGRTKQELDKVICWLTGYSSKALASQIKEKTDFETFFSEAPALNPNVSKITSEELGKRLRTGSPSIEVVSWEEKDSIKVTVFMLKAGEDKIVGQRLKEELEKASKA